MAPSTGVIVKAILFFVLAPGVVAGAVPYRISRWRVQSLLGLPGEHAAGALLAVAGLAVLLECVVRFVVVGRGTPAPVAPTEHLVVSGLYRYVRNPMYVAVIGIIVGQAVLFGSSMLLAYAVAVSSVFHLAVVLYEEPTLRRQFGESYATYQAQVPRWWPRLEPWSSSESEPRG